MSSYKVLTLYLIGLYLQSCFTCTEQKPNDVSSEVAKNQLDHVQINHQNISEITKTLFRGVTDVKKLEIEHSNVRSIEEGAFSGLSALQKLSLKHNLLKEIKNNIFSKLPIRELDLGDNQIQTIEANAFENMRNLKTLSLKNNRIETWNNRWFEDTPILSYIHFENNLIKTLPKYVVNHPKFSYYYIYLFLSYNKIEEIDVDAFENIVRFGKLYLDHNSIKVIQNGTFSRATDIWELRLDYNQIVCIDSEEVRPVMNITIDGNPWDQQCLLDFQEQRSKYLTTTTTQRSRPHIFFPQSNYNNYYFS